MTFVIVGGSVATSNRDSIWNLAIVPVIMVGEPGRAEPSAKYLLFVSTQRSSSTLIGTEPTLRGFHSKPRASDRDRETLRDYGICRIVVISRFTYRFNRKKIASRSFLFFRTVLFQASFITT